MASFQLDEKGHSHAKVLAAGNEAYGAWTRAGQWSSDHRTDGFIPRAVALSIAPAEVWDRLRDARAGHEHGLVEEREGDWQIHDFLDHNLAAAARRSSSSATSAARREAGRTGGARSGAARRAKQPGTKTEATAEQTGSNPEATAEQAGSKTEATAKQTGSKTEATAKQTEAPPSRAPSRPDPDLNSDQDSDLDLEIQNQIQSEYYISGSPDQIPRGFSTDRSLPELGDGSPELAGSSDDTVVAPASAAGSRSTVAWSSLSESAPPMPPRPLPPGEGLPPGVRLGRSDSPRRAGMPPPAPGAAPPSSPSSPEAQEIFDRLKARAELCDVATVDFADRIAGGLFASGKPLSEALKSIDAAAVVIGDRAATNQDMSVAEIVGLVRHYATTRKFAHRGRERSERLQGGPSFLEAARAAAGTPLPDSEEFV